MAAPATIGFIGLGKMGRPMARRLAQHGYRVRGFDPVAGARDALVSAGGVACASAAETAEGAEAVITMLPDGGIVRAVMLEGPAPVTRAMRPGTVLIEMSSSA